MPAPLDEDVVRFILTSIPSISHLEAALLFRREPGARDAGEVARALYVGERDAALALSSLAEAGVLARDADAFRYAPRDARLADLLDRLALAYAADLVGVTKLVHDQTRDSARRFADAFKLKRGS